MSREHRAVQPCVRRRSFSVHPGLLAGIGTACSRANPCEGAKKKTLADSATGYMGGLGNVEGMYGHRAVRRDALL
jgi:hypothetical protein